MTRLRIKDHSHRPEFSIAVVVGAALLLWFAIMLWSASTSARADQRTLTEVRVTHQCDESHRFRDLAGIKSLPCSQAGCTSRGWPIWSYQCTKHGAFLYQLRYHVDDSDRIRIQSARPVGGKWEEVDDDIICSHCERALLPDATLRAHVNQPVPSPLPEQDD